MIDVWRQMDNKKRNIGGGFHITWIKKRRSPPPTQKNGGVVPHVLNIFRSKEGDNNEDRFDVIRRFTAFSG